MDSSSFFDSSNFMPHGMCYMWKPDILWTSVISDVLTGLAYFSITAAVIIFVKKRQDLPYPWFFLLAGSIIFLACGMSHIISAIVIWEPIYGVSAIVKAITAVTSVLTGILIWVVLPFFLELPSPSMLEKKNKALEDTIEKLNAAQASLVESEKMASLGGLVAGIAHEINTPIGIAVTASSHLIDSTESLSKKLASNELRRKELDHYAEDSTRCANLINNNLRRSAELITSFKLVAVDHSNTNLRQYNVNEYTKEIITHLQPALGKKGCKFALTCDDSIYVWGDPSELTQIITNLVMNSLIHGFENNNQGKIELVITQQDEEVVFDYQDTGCGINTEHQDKIFEPFFTTKRGQGSSGLGMHIVFNLVTQSLKGIIECLSSEGNGTQFILKFPMDTRKVAAEN